MHHVREFLFFFFLLLLIQFSTSRDTLISGQTLENGESLISANETFALGFFTPGVSKNRYLGIWYNKVPEKKVVWVANRDNPINDTSGVLTFQNSGNLVLYGPDLKNPIWSANFSGLAKNHSAKLLDTGNLVVFREENKGVTAWQSFDHPTDTMLPMMKLGANRKTGLKWSLTSWKSLDDPGTGEYQYRIDLGKYSELSLYKGSDRIWRTGPWNGVRLSGVPEMSSNFIFNVTYVDDEDEVYMMYGMRDPSVYSIMVVEPSGVMERMTWRPESRQWGVFWSAPKVPCDDYDRCGPNGNCDAPSSTAGFECSCLPGFEPKSPRDWYLRDGSGGCVRKRDRNVCRNREGFVKLSGTKIPDTTKTRVNKSLGLKECETECLTDCKCTAYTSSNVSEGAGSGCVRWYGDLVDTRQFQSGGVDLFLRVDAVEVAESMKKQHSSSNKGKVAAAVGSVGGAVTLLIVLLLCWLRKGSHSKRPAKLLYSTSNSTFSHTSLTEQFDERQTSGDFSFLDLKTLAEATDNFSIENKLGEGGFGSVYKGTLKKGQEIAVKRLSKSSGQGGDEFKNEATLIAKLQHRNLVRLLGYCAQQEEKMLIYEYLPNNSLDTLIFDKTKGSCLDWAQRFSIIMGITRGMVYLHQDSRLRIIHRDLKASNVLLDAAMIPKISDFGMARIFGGDQIEANTNRVVGTYGYMSPEYAMEGHFSTKSVVFSFGVLLLEIISGRKNKSFYEDNCVNYLGIFFQVWEFWREERALEIIDPSLGDSYSAKEVLRCIHVGLLSVQEQAVDRPTISEVAYMLSNETALPPPRQPAFIFKKFVGQYSSSASVGAQSSNDITLSVIEAR